MLPNETDEDQTDSSDLAKGACEPASTQPSMMAMGNLLDLIHTRHKASISRTDASHITEDLGSLIQQEETQAQHSRLIYPSINIFLGSGP